MNILKSILLHRKLSTNVISFELLVIIVQNDHIFLHMRTRLSQSLLAVRVRKRGKLPRGICRGPYARHTFSCTVTRSEKVLRPVCTRLPSCHACPCALMDHPSRAAAYLLC